MFSLERRRERYRIIYVWKILEKLVPNIETNGEIKEQMNERTGRSCHVKTNVINSCYKARRLRDHSFSWNACLAFNSLPKSIRNISSCSVETFKTKLDKYLLTILDEPQITGMTMFRKAEMRNDK